MQQQQHTSMAVICHSVLEARTTLWLGTVQICDKESLSPEEVHLYVFVLSSTFKKD